MNYTFKQINFNTHKNGNGTVPESAFFAEPKTINSNCFNSQCEFKYVPPSRPPCAPPFNPSGPFAPCAPPCHTAPHCPPPCGNTPPCPPPFECTPRDNMRYFLIGVLFGMDNW